MLKLTKKSKENNLVNFYVEFDESDGNIYEISFDVSLKYEEPISTTIPERYSLKIAQARTAVDRYFQKEIPDVIYSETH